MLRPVKLILILLILLLIAPVQAQSDSHPPQILYRKDGQLYLADATTGVSKALLSIETSEQDKWIWSPDGRYILGIVEDNANLIASLKIYDVDRLAYWESAPEIQSVTPIRFGGVAWSPDSKKISYAQNVDNGTGQLWVFDVTSGKQTLIYQTLPPRLYSTGVAEQWWSPSSQRLLFRSFNEIIGGAEFSLYLVNVNNNTPVFLYEQYYANYDPIWSLDSQWILLRLKNTYYAGPDTVNDDQGDVYLYSSVDGTQFPITDTPEIEEKNLRWTTDGQHIQYESEGQHVSVSLQDVLDHSVDQIPKQIEPILYTRPALGVVQISSPDDALIAFLYRNLNRYNLWVVDSERKNYLKIAEVQSSHDLIGWRP